ncbi:MAG: hypothetical protein LBR32_09900 [Propionibacteriaceae bacterium]|jgi:hypothetical protein|nr:hypothetical protein [Propionibacteriaceae bacterium]
MSAFGSNAPDLNTPGGSQSGAPKRAIGRTLRRQGRPRRARRHRPWDGFAERARDVIAHRLRMTGVGLLTAVVGGALLAANTQAAFTDAAWLNLAGPLGGPHTFQIGLVEAGKFELGAGGPLDLGFPDEDALAPGRTVERVVRVANNHPELAAALAMRVTARPVAGRADISGSLRVTVVDGAGRVFAGADPQQPEKGAVPDGSPFRLDTLKPRGLASLADQAAWVDGKAGSDKAYTVLVHCLDDPALETQTGGWAEVAVAVDAASAN